jgi:hypothetical protein
VDAAPPDAPVSDAPTPDAPPPDARPDAPGLPEGARCDDDAAADAGATAACADGLLCCTPCCGGQPAVCTRPAANDAGIGVGRCPLPDLTVRQSTLADSVWLDQESFDPTSCEIVEGCVTTPGTRSLLHFSVQTPNLGTADLALGDPTMNPLFQFSPCHGHYHFNGYARFAIYDAEGREVVTGRKQAFCLIDVERDDSFPLARQQPQFDCGNQGISIGWSDIYSSGLPCQFIDVTDVPPGQYRLVVAIDPDNLIPELDDSNNTAEVMVQLGPPPTGPTGRCDPPTVGLTRECGFTNAGTFSCSAGQPVRLGCGASCPEALGSCSGDTVLRVCDGTQPCSSPSALAQNDDCAGGTGCSSVSFTCPPSGQYTVLTGAFSSDATAVCTLAHQP